MIWSFIVYIFSFFVSSLAIAFFVKKKRSILHRRGIVRFFAIILACILPILLGAFRKGIGVDYYTYGIIFDRIKNSSLKEYLLTQNGIEIVNFVIVKIGFLLFKNMQGVYFLYVLFTIILMVDAVMYFKDKIAVFFSVMFLYILYYPGLYNTIRQYLAIAIILYSYRFVFQRDFIKFCICILIATGVHSTAIIMVFSYFLYNTNSTNYSSFIKRLLHKSTVIVLILFPFISSRLFSFARVIPFFSRYFDFYQIERTNIVTSIIFKLPVYIPLIISAKNNIRKEKNIAFYYYLLLVEFEFLLLSSLYKWAFRLSFYAVFSQVILVGFTLKAQNSKSKRFLLSIYYLSWYLLQFWIFYVVWKRDGIIPYTWIFN